MILTDTDRAARKRELQLFARPSSARVALQILSLLPHGDVGKELARDGFESGPVAHLLGRLPGVQYGFDERSETLPGRHSHGAIHANVVGRLVAGLSA